MENKAFILKMASKVAADALAEVREDIQGRRLTEGRNPGKEIWQTGVESWQMGDPGDREREPV